MRVFKILSFVGAMMAGATAAQASTITSGNIPLVAQVESTSGTTFNGFVTPTSITPGEDVSINIVMDGTITRTGGSLQARFFSTTGTFSVTGLTSGTTFQTSPGVEAYVANGVTSFRSISGVTGLILARTPGIVLNGPLFEVAPDFSTYLSYFTGDVSSTGSFALVDTATGSVATFSNPSVIPLPAAGLLLIGGLGVLALRRKMAA